MGDKVATASALEGIDVAYYLVHSTAGGRGFPRGRPTPGHYVRSGGGEGRYWPDRLCRSVRERPELCAPGKQARGGLALAAAAVVVMELRAAVVFGSGAPLPI